VAFTNQATVRVAGTNAFVRAVVAPTAPTVDFSAKKLKFESKYDHIVQTHEHNINHNSKP
jgi:hypothetical protein